LRITASNTRRSRLLSSSGGITSKLVTTSEECQVGGEGIESKPPARRQANPRCVGRRVGNRRPAGVRPYRNTSQFLVRNRKTVYRTKAQVHPFGDPVFVGKHLVPGDRVATLLYRGEPLAIRRKVPATRPAVELMRRRTHAGIVAITPVRRVVPRPLAGSREVRDLVMLEPRRAERVVRVQELLLVRLLRRFSHLAARLPAAEHCVRLDRKAVQRD